MATYSIDLTKLAGQWDTAAGNFKVGTDVSLGNTKYTLGTAGTSLDILNAAGTKVGTLVAEAADGNAKPKTLTFTPETATTATTISFTQGAKDSGYVLTKIVNGEKKNYTYTGIDSTTTITSSDPGVATVLMEGNDVSLGAGTTAVYRLSDSVKNAITIGAGATGTVNAYVYGQDSIYDADDKVAGVTSDGKLKLDGATAEVDVRLADNAYRAEITKQDKTKAQYWTAAANASAVTMDAGAVTGKTPVTFTLSNAQAAKIVSGRYNDTIVGTANVDSAITYEISRERGEDTFTNVTFGTDDLIIFDNATDLAAGEITVKGADLYYGGHNQQTTTLKGALDSNGGQTNFSFDKGSTKYVAGYGKSIAWSTDKDIYIGDSNGADVSSITAALQGVDLSDTKKYRDIKEVVVGADVAAGSVFKGLKDTATTVDATAATKGIYWYGNTSASNKAATGAVVSLNGGTFAQDTVQFGATEGSDTVYSFQGGFGSTDDILYFDSAASIKDVKLSKTNGADGNITLGAGDASLNVTLASGTEKSDALLMQFSDGVTKKVALETAKKNAGVADTITADGADIVYGYSDTASKNWVEYTAAQTDDLLINFTTETDKYLNIHNIDASGSAAAITYAGKVGDKDAMTIKTGTGTALVWAAQSSNDSIQIGSDGEHLADVWYAGALKDGKDTIGGTAQSLKQLRVEFVGVSSLKDLRSSYTTSDGAVAAKSANVVYTYNNDTKNTLTILDNDNKALKGFTVILDNNADYTQRTTVKASLANDTAVHTFSTDTKLYTGTSASVAAGADITTEQFISLGNGDEATSNPGTDYYFDKNVKVFDASGSNAAFTLVGRGYGVDSTLKGGYTRNLFWGGGHTSDTFYGQEDALDMVMFGQDDGMDTFKNFGTNDAVYLYDVDDISKVSVASDNMSISLNNGASVLKLDEATGRATDATSLTFYDANRNGYTYDGKKFTATGKNF